MFPEVVLTIQAELTRLEQELAEVEATRKQKKSEMRRIKRMLGLASNDGSQRRRGAGRKKGQQPLAESAYLASLLTFGEQPRI